MVFICLHFDGNEFLSVVERKCVSERVSIYILWIELGWTDGDRAFCRELYSQCVHGAGLLIMSCKETGLQA